MPFMVKRHGAAAQGKWGRFWGVFRIWGLKHGDCADCAMLFAPFQGVFRPQSGRMDAGAPTMQFPVVLHTDDGTHYGVIVPDLPGCFSGGTGIDWVEKI